MKNKASQPPKWATGLLRAYCRRELLEDLEGDLAEYFDRNLTTRGAFMAKLIYIIDVLKFFRAYTVHKPSFSNLLNKRVMLANYIKTSRRSILRSKLFSAINIIGLAVSMSIGLLVIAMITDLRSYDSTLENRDRIYRVTSTQQPAGQGPHLLASTSWKAGQLIQDEVPGVASLTILRNNFGGDARIGDNIIPVSGFYADNNFFKVFSFPLVSGVTATALKQPNSLVLTQETATKLFGSEDAMGKTIRFDSTVYTVTGIMQNIPKLSHIHFELLASLSSINTSNTTADGDYMDWTNCYSNYVYVLLNKNSSVSSFSDALKSISTRQNKPAANSKILLSLQSLSNIPMGPFMENEIGPSFPSAIMYVFIGLAVVILLSACFNYTNLSIARALRRSREVGIRKVMGAGRWQVITQFIVESVIISLIALCAAFLMFLVLRGQFLSFREFLQRVFSLNLTIKAIVYFICLGVLVGVVAGLLPAMFYAKVNAVQVLKNASSLKVFRHVSFRKVLVVIQYTLSLIFITTTIIGYHQYKGFVRLNLGFKTEHILNIDMQGNKEDVLAGQLAGLSAVNGVSRSAIVSSLGSIYGTSVKYNDPLDSAGVMLNDVDANYLPLHQYTFMAGRNFTALSKDAKGTETVVNERLIKRFNIGRGNAQKAIGETVHIGGKDLFIVGVLKDFHYGTADRQIEPTALRYSTNPGGYLNVKLNVARLSATMTAINTFWKQIDKVHPLNARFYDAQIEDAYSQFSVMLKIVGFIALLAICISSLGLFGMVIYTMEKRVKEMSIRKVLGAGDGLLAYLLSKGFLVLLLVAALIALPLTWLFFNKVILTNFAYHKPIGFSDMFTGLAFVAGVALIMIGTQTLRIVRSNPAKVLKTE